MSTATTTTAERSMETVEIQKNILDDLIESTRKKSEGLQQYAIVPKGIEEAERYSKYIIRSKWAPKDWTEADVFIAVQHGLELGIHPLQAIQGMAVINGRPSIYGDLLLAVVLRSGLVEEWFERPAKEALAKGEGYFRIKRKDNPHPIEVYFTQADATKAGLWGKTGPWTSYPGRMLQMRARSWALRDGFADILKGMAVVEEARDIEVEAPTVAEIIRTPMRKSEIAKETVSSPKPDATPAPAPVQTVPTLAPEPPAAEPAEGSGEYLITKVELVPYKDAKSGADKKFYKLTVADQKRAFATWSDTEAGIASDCQAKKIPVHVVWQLKPGKENRQIKKLSPVLPQPSESEIPDEPGSNG